MVKQCQLHLTGDVSVNSKPGMCPHVSADTVGICVEECSSDSQCSGDLKCCSNGCGHTCQTGVNITSW